MHIVLDVLSWVLLLAGGGIAVVAGWGVVKLPDVFSRMHAASMLDSLGALCIFAGLALQAGFTLISFKLLVGYAFLMLTTATAAHVLGKAALRSGVVPVQTSRGAAGGGDGDASGDAGNALEDAR